MNLSSPAASLPPAASPSPHVLPGLPNATLLTRVSLAFVEQRINLYLRFGHPTRELRLDRW
ncbi:hypothetical protein B1B_07383, partial [mine drainage metagenome]